VNNTSGLARKQALTNLQAIFWVGLVATVDTILHEALSDPQRIGRRA
jgi:hypothetical protein